MKFEDVNSSEKLDVSENEIAKGLLKAYLTEKENNSPRKLCEYKVFCFNGKAKIMLVCQGTAHQSGRTNDYCDMNLNRLPFTSLYPNSDEELERPEELEEIIMIAERLACNIPFVRVDTYLIDRKVYFGELTFYHNAGFAPIVPKEWDDMLGSWIDLSLVKRCNSK